MWRAEPPTGGGKCPHAPPLDAATALGWGLVKEPLGLHNLSYSELSLGSLVKIMFMHGLQIQQFCMLLKSMCINADFKQ